MKRSEKETTVANLKSEWSETSTAFLVGFRGLTVPAATTLRHNVRGVKASYRVVRNTLATLALDGTPLAGLVEQLDGPTAVAYTNDDPVALAKVLVDFAKDHPGLEVRGGVLEGQSIDAQGVAQVASMPSRPELQAQLVMVLASPLRRLAVALNAPISQFVNVLEQVRKQKEEAA